MTTSKAARTTSNHNSDPTPTSPRWTIGYSEWENITSPATPGETVAEAEAAERDGWPYVVSGDQTTKLVRAREYEGLVAGILRRPEAWPHG